MAPPPPGPPAPARPPLPPGPYVVAGLGRAGCAAVEALAQRVDLDEIVATDHSKSSRVRRRRRRAEAGGVRTVIATPPPLFDAGPAARCVVKSPGIPFDAPLLRRA